MGGNMRHARGWVRFFAQCVVAVALVHLATGAGLLQAMATLALFLWAGLLVMQALERLLRAFSWPPDDDEGDDGGGPEEHLPIINTEPEEPKRKEWRN